MPRYDYKVALNALNETDKNRLLACYLSSENSFSTTDWDHATASFGAASNESMKVMVRNALKKIKEAGGEGGVSTAPTKTPKSAKGRKRKTDDDDDDDDDDAADAGAEASPSKKAPKKSRGRPKKTEEDSDVDDQIKREVEEAAAGN